MGSVFSSPRRSLDTHTPALVRWHLPSVLNQPGPPPAPDPTGPVAGDKKATAAARPIAVEHLYLTLPVQEAKENFAKNLADALGDRLLGPLYGLVGSYVLDCARPGCRLEALDADMNWLRARITDIQPGLCLIHFEGWDERYDVWFPSQSSKLAPLGTHTAPPLCPACGNRLPVASSLYSSERHLCQPCT